MPTHATISMPSAADGDITILDGLNGNVGTLNRGELFTVILRFDNNNGDGLNRYYRNLKVTITTTASGVNIGNTTYAETNTQTSVLSDLNPGNVDRPGFVGDLVS